YTYFVEFLFLLIAIMSVILWGANFRSIVLSSSLLSMGIFLDPNLFPHSVIALSLTIVCVRLAQTLSKKSLGLALSRVFTLILFTFPALATSLYVLNETTGTNLRAPALYLRATGNLTLANAVRLFAFWWSLIVYAPPSVSSASQGLSTLPSLGNPPYMLLPDGFLSQIWLASTLVMPLVSFATLGLLSYRRATLPAAVIGVIGITLTQPAVFPYPYELATAMN